VKTKILFLRGRAILAALGFGVIQVQAQNFRVSGIKLEPQNGIRIGFPVDTNAYYILYRGTTVTNISQPVSLVLGTGPMGDLADQHSSMMSAFYRVRQVSQATPLDTDQDGIDDVYEIQHGDFLSAVNSLDAAQDHDGDGKSNLEQYQQETGGTGGGSETCCERDIFTYSIPSPPGQLDHVRLPLDTVFLHPSKSCPSCFFMDADTRELKFSLIDALTQVTTGQLDPEAQEIVKQGLDADYHLIGSVSVANPIIQEGYNVQGDITLTMMIFDPHHSAVVKRDQTSWSGTINSQEGTLATEMLGTSFGSLSQILHDYEHIPIEAAIEPQYDPALAGEEMTIHLKDIKGDGGQPKEWWRIFVKAEKGKILNGTEYGEYRWFKVGAGTVDIQYKAPEDCGENEITETITVKNTCNMKEITHEKGPLEKVIGTKTFKIFCTKFHFDVDYPAHWDMGEFVVDMPFNGTVPFHAERSGQQIILKGGGSLKAPLTGTMEDCTLSGNAEDLYTIEGDFLPQKEGPAILRLEITERVSMNGILQCPDDEPSPMSLPPMDLPWDSAVEIPAREGYVLDLEHLFGAGTKEMTLHRP
jgi:hypothetical protein